jgi:hypothetical protein
MAYSPPETAVMDFGVAQARNATKPAGPAADHALSRTSTYNQRTKYLH